MDNPMVYAMARAMAYSMGLSMGRPMVGQNHGPYHMDYHRVVLGVLHGASHGARHRHSITCASLDQEDPRCNRGSCIWCVVSQSIRRLMPPGLSEGLLQHQCLSCIRRKHASSRTLGMYFPDQPRPAAP